LQDALTRERRFVGDAGHELRTPLTVLPAELELASRPGRSLSELREAVGFAGVETDRLIRLAEHLLLLARIDEGQPMLHRSPTSLKELLGTAVRGMQTRAHPRQVVLDAPDDVVLLADAERIRQAVDNVLDNAIRLAPPGTEVTVTLRRQDEPPPSRAVVEIADRGPGLPQDFLDRAFERFERADAARTRDTGGSGLGLSIVRSLVRAHGGDATASNRDGGGAVVRLELPLDGAETDAALPPARPVASPHP
jgi:two-component system, OmpR family, sensor kinase